MKKYQNENWIHNQYRRNLDDFWELCRDCHKLYDKLMKKREWKIWAVKKNMENRQQ